MTDRSTDPTARTGDGHRHTGSSHPARFVVATAGHVDHGKSTLVRALTGMEPDRFAEEQRRGLTIDLGFGWTTLPSGAEVAFVDVPGHERFLGNMLAGLGPSPVVCFVVAADEGWRAQSSDHRDAVAALGIRHGVIVVTRADLAPDRVDEVAAQARAELADTALATAPVVATSATTGAGLDTLRATLDDLLAGIAPPEETARIRFWIDRSFTITGAGTVLTGTLSAGTLGAGDRLDLLAEGRPSGSRTTAVVVRSLQRQGRSTTVATATCRLAINLRAVPVGQVRRGDVLLSPGAWVPTSLVDVRGVSGASLDEAPEHVVVHVGTAAVPTRLRPFGAQHGRLRLDRALPLVHGDRLVLRDPSSRRVLAGVVVLDADPPLLDRRGDAARRARDLEALGDGPDLPAEVRRRGAVRRSHLVALGLTGPDPSAPAGVVAVGDWWVDGDEFDRWSGELGELVANRASVDPLSAGPTTGAAESALGLPDGGLLAAVAGRAGLVIEGGHVRRPGSDVELGPIEAAVEALRARLRAEPFAAPEADELAALGLGARELAAAERTGRLLRLGGGVVLLPDAPARAVRVLAGLPQPFTTSEARQALGMTRRTVIPLLEYLDRRGWTRRVDTAHREIVRPDQK